MNLQKSKEPLLKNKIFLCRILIFFQTFLIFSHFEVEILREAYKNDIKNCKRVNIMCMTVTGIYIILTDVYMLGTVIYTHENVGYQRVNIGYSHLQECKQLLLKWLFSKYKV